MRVTSIENEAGERSMDQHQTAADEPPSQSDIWMTTLVLAQDMAVVLKEGVEEEVGMMYEVLDQTFKWNERRRERVENAHNELLRSVFPLSFYTSNYCLKLPANPSKFLFFHPREYRCQ
jgi:hypothetical protein